MSLFFIRHLQSVAVGESLDSVFGCLFGVPDNKQAVLVLVAPGLGLELTVTYTVTTHLESTQSHTQ